MVLPCEHGTATSWTLDILQIFIQRRKYSLSYSPGTPLSGPIRATNHWKSNCIKQFFKVMQCNQFNLWWKKYDKSVHQWNKMKNNRIAPFWKMEWTMRWTKKETAKLNRPFIQRMIIKIIFLCWILFSIVRTNSYLNGWHFIIYAINFPWIFLFFLWKYAAAHHLRVANRQDKYQVMINYIHYPLMC